MLKNSQATSKSFGTVNGLLTTMEAAALLGFTPRLLELRRSKGGGPKYVRISARGIRYRIEDLESWIASQIRSSTSE